MRTKRTGIVFALPLPERRILADKRRMIRYSPQEYVRLLAHGTACTIVCLSAVVLTASGRDHIKTVLAGN
jgi:hypothetical protein